MVALWGSEGTGFPVFGQSVTATWPDGSDHRGAAGIDLAQHTDALHTLTKPEWRV